MNLLKKSRGVGISLSYVYTFLNMICGLFISAYLVRMLGDVEYGVYQTVGSFANYLVLLEFGLGTVMVRNLSACRVKKEGADVINKNVSTLWSITVVLSVIITVISIVFYFLIGVIFKNSLTVEQVAHGKNIFIFITAYLILSFIAQTLEKIPIAYEHYSFTSVVAIVKLLLRTGLLIGLIFAFKNAIIIAIVDAGLSLLISMFAFVYCKKEFKIKFSFKNFDKKIFKAAVPLCMAIFLQAIVNQANSNVAKFIIGIKLKPEIVTLFSVGLYVYSIFSSITTIPISMYAPQVTKSVTIGVRGKELTETLVQPSRLIALIGGLVLFGFIAVGKQFITIVYTSDYILAYYIAIILMTPMFINMSTGVLINVLDAMNKRMARSLILLATTALNIVLTILWIDKYGILGATFSTSICTFIGQVIILDIYYAKVIKINIFSLYFKTYQGILLYQIIGTVVGSILASLVSNIYLSFLIGGCAFVLIALGGFWLFGKNEEEKQLFKKLLKRKQSESVSEEKVKNQQVEQDDE